MQHLFFIFAIFVNFIGNDFLEYQAEIQAAEGKGTFSVALPQKRVPLARFRSIAEDLPGSESAPFSRSNFVSQHSGSNGYFRQQGPLEMSFLSQVEQAESQPMWLLRPSMAQVLRSILCPGSKTAEEPAEKELHRMERRGSRRFELGVSFSIVSPVFEVTKAIQTKRQAITPSSQSSELCRSASLRSSMEFQADSYAACCWHQSGFECDGRSSRTATSKPCGQTQREGHFDYARRDQSAHCGEHHTGGHIKDHEPSGQEDGPGQIEISECSKGTQESAFQVDGLSRREHQEMEELCRGLWQQGQGLGGEGQSSQRLHAESQRESRSSQRAAFTTRCCLSGGRSGSDLRHRRGTHEGRIGGMDPERHRPDGHQSGRHSHTPRSIGGRECQQKGQTHRSWIWYFCFGAFCQAEQVDRIETCLRLSMPLCFHESPPIWNHSILNEECFLTPWQASICALDLSYEVGTWCSSSPLQLCEGVRKPSGRQVRFSNHVELYVGPDLNIDMARWDAHLSEPIRHHALFRDVSSTARFTSQTSSESHHADDISLLAYHAHQVRDAEHMDVVDQGHPEDDPPSSSDTESISLSDFSLASEPEQWFPTMIYAIGRDAVSRIMNWKDQEYMHNNIAAAVQVEPDELHTYHHVACRPRDLQRARVEPVIAHRVHDIQPGDPRLLVLLDVEFHSNHPTTAPETVRQVHKIMDLISRRRLLAHLGLQAYCRRSRNRCLVWVNDELIPFGTARLHLYDGDYIRIAVPPSSPRMDPLATRCIATAFHQGHTIHDILERHTMYLLGWRDSVIGPPHLPLQHAENFADENSMLQMHYHQLPPLDEPPCFLCQDRWHVHGQSQPPKICNRLEDDDPVPRITSDSEWIREINPTHAHDLDQQPQFIRDLIMVLASFTTTDPPHDEPRYEIATWFLDGINRRQSYEARTVTLGISFVDWLHQILLEWQDTIEVHDPLQVYLVRPKPRVTQSASRPAAHLILVQHALPEDFANLFTVVPISNEVQQFVKFAPVLMNKPQIIASTDLASSCPLISSEVQCVAWHGEHQIRDHFAVRNRDGLSYLIIVNRLPAATFSTATTSAAQTHDEESLLQISFGKVQLCLDDLIKNTVAVDLVDATHSRLLPNPLEVEHPGTAVQIAQELQHWGHQCDVFHCPVRQKYLCIDQVDHGQGFHYWFCHDDPADALGSFLHSSLNQLTEIEIMSLLCQLEYPRAVILQRCLLCPHWERVVFHHREPHMPQAEAKVKIRSPWPTRSSRLRTSLRLFPQQASDLVPAQQPACSLHTGITAKDLDDLAHSSDSLLCTNLEVLNLSEQLLSSLQEYPLCPLVDIKELDHYDRLLIFTDGSSKPAMRHCIAQQADELGFPDTWAFAVAAEQYIGEQQSKIVLLGWTTQPVRYDEAGSAYMGIDRIGSDMAERAGLIGAAMWRLSIDHCITTVFCVDSDTGGKQAFGLIGTAVPDASYRLLRSLYQALELGLPSGALQLHHTRSHAGDPLNELVDRASRLEAVKSLNLPRQRINLCDWSPKFQHLWTIFGSSIGLPHWQDGVLDVHKPSLPQMQQHHEPPPTTSASSQFALSLATANVQSLSRGPHGHAGKLKYLQQQMRAHGLNCMAIQESRTDAGMSCADHILRLCSGHCNGQYGLKIWIDLERPYSWSSTHKAAYFKPHHFQCVHAEPRSMLLRCDAPDLSFWLVVIHAPHGGHSADDRRQWWASLQQLLQTHHDGDPLLLLGDANAAPGLYDGITVLDDTFRVTNNTAEFRQLLEIFDLYLPATSEVHQGSRDTWTEPSGLRTHCLDHIAIPREWQCRCSLSQVLFDFDLANIQEDHRATAIQLQWSASRTLQATSNARPRRHWTSFDAPSLQQHLQNFEALPWHTDIETQAQHLTDHLHNALQASQQQQPVQAKKTYISDDVWEMRILKNHLKRKLTQIRHRRKMNMLFLVLESWKTSDATGHQLPNPYHISLQCSVLKFAAQQHVQARRLRDAIKAAKTAALQECIHGIEHTTPAAEILRTLKGFIGPTNPRKCKRKMLPMVRNSDGQTCTLPSEALSTWIQFFQNMEGGERMQYSQLREIWIQELEGFGRDELQHDLDSLPSLTDLELAMRRVPCGKALGPDGLPGELLRYHPKQVAQLLYPQLIKMVLHGHEALTYKGGILQPAYKGRGPVDSCHSYRSLLVSNHLGKVMHRTLRQKQASIYERYMQRQQTGGRRKVPVQLAAHQVRAFARQACHANRSTSIIYLDLSEAFYTVLRETALGGCPSDEAIAHVLQRLSLPPSAMDDIRRLLQEPPAVEQAGFSLIDQRCWQAVHTSTHFWLRDQFDVSRTRLGTRPGDSLADVVFGYVWSRVLQALQDIMLHRGVLFQYHGHDHLPLFGHESVNGSIVPFLGPTWMDDLAVCLESPDADQIASQTGFVAGALLDLCEQHCLKPNLSKGKTEIQITFRGRGSRQQRTRFFGPLSDQRLPVACEAGIKYLNLVNCYKHLGGLVHHTADQIKEIQHRAAMAHTAMNQHRRLLYQNPDLQFQKRKEIFDMLVMTKMLYGADSWVMTNKHAFKKFETTIYGLYRRLLKLKPDQQISNEEVLVQADLLGPSELLSRCRLRYIVTLVQLDMPDIWGLFALDCGWKQLLEADIHWMWCQLRSTTDLPDPSVSFGPWLHILQHCPGFWKRLVRRACDHCILQRRRIFMVRRFHRQFLDRVWQNLSAHEPRPHRLQPDLETFHGCLGCNMRCKNHAGEAAHMCRKHGIVSHLRKLADQPSCPACLKYFHSMQKLKAHLYYSRDCQDQLRARDLQCLPVPGSGSQLDLERVVQHDRQLPPLRSEGPLPPPIRAREAVWHDEGLYDYILDCFMDLSDCCQIELNIREHVRGLAISWTRFVQTIDYIINTFAEEDASFFGLPYDDLHATLQHLRTPNTWDLFRVELRCESTLESLELLQEECLLATQALQRTGLTKIPRPCGRHRIVLHAYAGRRRMGDIQYYLEQIAAQQSEYILHVISLDVVIDKEWGDVTNPATCMYWLHAIRRQWVLAFICGPPCETWSRARGKAIHAVDSDGHPCVRRGPRVIRTSESPWGLESTSLKELRQLCIGNDLLFFALRALLDIAETNGYGLLEHPAEPWNEPEVASIWRVDVMQTLLSLDHVQLVKIAQGLMGSASPKPTNLLAINLPNLIFHIHAGRVRKELPTSSAIGTTAQGTWMTAPLKEYAPAFCRSIANSLMESFSDLSVDPSAVDPPADFLNQCSRMEATEYSELLGNDYAGWT